MKTLHEYGFVWRGDSLGRKTGTMGQVFFFFFTADWNPQRKQVLPHKLIKHRYTVKLRDSSKKKQDSLSPELILFEERHLVSISITLRT